MKAFLLILIVVMWGNQFYLQSRIAKMELDTQTRDSFMRDIEVATGHTYLIVCRLDRQLETIHNVTWRCMGAGKRRINKDKHM